MASSKRKSVDKKSPERSTKKSATEKKSKGEKKDNTTQKLKIKLVDDRKSTRISTSQKKSLKRLNYLRSASTKNATPYFSEELSDIEDEYGRKVFTGRHLIKLKKDSKITHLESLAKKASLRIASIANLKTTPGGSIKMLDDADGVIFPNANVVMLNSKLEDRIRFLTSSKEGHKYFNYAEPERFIYPAAAAKRNPQFINNRDSTWGLQATNIFQSNRTGSGIKIAILDTGLNTDHVDFQNRSGLVSASFIPNEDAKDLLGHGTRCAGIACGVRTTDGPRYGVAPGAELFIGKVIAKDGRGTDTSLLDGIEWALNNSCHIVNLSVVRAIARGETGFSNTYEELAAKALSNKCLIIAAAGNESNRKFRVIKPVAEPANCPSILAVGALDQNINVANFSCGGLVQDGGQIDIAAPGVEILSTHLKSTYNSDSGTSFASPIVAGMAALIWEENQQATAAEIWMKLTQKAKRLNINASDVGVGLAFLS